MMGRYVEDPPYIKTSKPGSIDGIGFGLLVIWLATLQIVLDKGQQEDWFSSTWITWFSGISVSALLAVRELPTPEPIVDLRVFRNRNFWVGTSMIGLMMAAMYSALTMLPLFLQTLLGYTAQNSSLATAPRGIGALLAVPFVGLLMSYVDGRWLASLGVACVAASTLLFAGSPSTFRWLVSFGQTSCKELEWASLWCPSWPWRWHAPQPENGQCQRYLQPDAKSGR